MSEITELDDRELEAVAGGKWAVRATAIATLSYFGVKSALAQLMLE